LIRKYLSEAKAEISSLLLTGSRALEEAGLDNPSHESQSVMAAVLGVTRAGVFARLRDELSEAERGTFLAWIERRAKREPIQYITGRAEFSGLMFTVNQDVLIPRPETELLVTEGISLLKDAAFPSPSPGRVGRGGEGGRGLKVADIGTGSGCVAVALAVNLPAAEIYAVDSSAKALDTAAVNARAHGVSGRVRLLAGDLLHALLPEGLEGRLDLIVSNPPYIPSGDIATLQPEVLYEPVAALDGGPDGLAAVRRIIKDAPRYLRPKGALLMEIGFGQCGAVKALVDAEPALAFDRFVPDFAGINRVLSAHRV
jgi:release factor glutamine methyltransferase